MSIMKGSEATIVAGVDGRNTMKPQQISTVKSTRDMEMIERELDVLGKNLSVLSIDSTSIKGIKNRVKTLPRYVKVNMELLAVTIKVLSELNRGQTDTWILPQDFPMTTIIENADKVAAKYSDPVHLLSVIIRYSKWYINKS